ncbi:MAG: arylsulfatase, partial [Verrucomicrobiota bacterium]|nr:arylsulfatase [Verrucomicrobiota bacterium]
MCAALGIALPAHAGPDSWNVLPAWLGEKTAQPLREATVCVSQSASVFSIRQGPWKLVVNDRKGALRNDNVDAPQLFNLAAELSEQKNLASAEPEKVKELDALLARYRAQGFSRPGWQPGGKNR